MQRTATFDRAETFELLAEWASVWTLRASPPDGFEGFDPEGRRRMRLRRPATLPPIAAGDTPASWSGRCRRLRGKELFVLFQAGASAVGVYDLESMAWIDRRVFRRYVVRGNGKAQPTHLKTRGKSRYGSRLRLQNAERLLEETCSWIDEAAAVDGPFGCVLRSCRDRLWTEVVATSPRVLGSAARVESLPVDLPRPTLDALDLAARSAHRGWVEEADLG